MKYFWSLLLIVLSTQVSCASKLKAEKETFDFVSIPPDSSINIPFLKALDSISKQEWHWYQSKIDVSLTSPDRNISFKTNLKCAKDSATSALITFAGIPLAQGLITKDSVLLVNKKDQCYSIKSLDYLKSLIGLDLSLKNVAELFMGYPLDFKSGRKYFIEYQTDHACKITCSDSTQGSNGKFKTIQYQYIYDWKEHFMTQEVIEIKADNTTITINYENFKLFDGQSLPTSTSIDITRSSQKMNLALTHKQTALNIPQEININIPESYESCP